MRFGSKEELIDSIEIEQRYTEFVRRRNSDGAWVCLICAHEVGYQWHVFFLGCLGRLLKSGFGDDAVLHQAPWQA